MVQIKKIFPEKNPTYEVGIYLTYYKDFITPWHQ